MSSLNSSEKFKWVRGSIDRILILNLFLVILGSILFLLSIIIDLQGIKGPLILFQKLWVPLFIPAITILISSIVFNSFFTWLKKQVPPQELDE